MRTRPYFWRQGNVVVSVHAPTAKQVFLAGSFNHWDATSCAMQRLPSGDWVATLERLPPGRYEYKFVIDGQWCCEPGCDMPYDGCPGCVPNTFGTMNRVMDVAEHRGPGGKLSSARPACADESQAGRVNRALAVRDGPRRSAGPSE